MAPRGGNEADAVVVDQERRVQAPRPRKTIMNIQPFTGKDRRYYRMADKLGEEAECSGELP